MKSFLKKKKTNSNDDSYFKINSAFVWNDCDHISFLSFL